MNWNMGPSDAYYTSDIVKDEVVAKAGKVPTTLELDWAPVKLASFSLTTTIDGNKVTGISDRFGNVTFIGIKTDSETDSETVKAVVTPSGTLTFLDGVEGTIDGDVVVNYRFDNESVRSDGPQVAAFTDVNMCVLV